MLVFSQFVQVLQLLKEDLEASNLSFCYIDGATKDRMGQVDRFEQNSSIPVFSHFIKSRRNRIEFNIR